MACEGKLRRTFLKTGLSVLSSASVSQGEDTDANAAIVRGEIAILQRLFSGQKAKQIIDFDYEAFFRRIGLDQFITSQRRTGLEGMIRRIKGFAAELTGEKA